jgi:cell division protein FtsL
MWVRNIKRTMTPSPPAQMFRENRYIYTGEQQTTVTGYAVRANKTATRRRVSPFNLIVGLLIVGTLIVMYVSSIITVNEIAADIGTLQTHYQRLLDSNAALQAEVNGKSSRERISLIAREQLGMLDARERPEQVTLDPDLVDRAAAVRKELGE